MQFHKSGVSVTIVRITEIITFQSIITMDIDDSFFKSSFLQLIDLKPRSNACSAEGSISIFCRFIKQFLIFS